MSLHVFGLIVTPYGTAANNRGENEGNMTTLQKILWQGEVHTGFRQRRFGSPSGSTGNTQTRVGSTAHGTKVLLKTVGQMRTLQIGKTISTMTYSDS